MAAFFDATGDNLPSLPPLDEAMTRSVGPKQRVTAVLNVLRTAAAGNRRSTGRPFYSIRTVARHFSLPATTVTRMYGQLKTEGVLGSMWGSKTIIEPAELDNDIRVRGMILLPVPLRAFSATSTYRLFVRNMQLSLWKERFGSQVLFYDDATFDTACLSEALLPPHLDGVIWLMPGRRASSCFARLADRGVKSLVITDEMPINGAPGYYLSWRDAVSHGLVNWKRSGTSKVSIVADLSSASAASLRLLQSCLTTLGFTVEVLDRQTAPICQDIGNSIAPESGLIFWTARVLTQLSDTAWEGLESVKNKRLLLIHGGIDSPFQSSVQNRLDLIIFDWAAISRRLVRDIVARGCLDHVERQTIFKATWTRAIRPLPPL